MKLKKLAKCSLATALILGSVGAIYGCKKDNDNNTIEKTEQEKTYDLYVQYMNAKGDTPLTYEQWLASIKGDKGEDGISPKVRINETTNYWEISTDNGTTWTSTGVKATGAEGEKGDPGDDAIAPQVRINQDTNYWEISTDNGVTWTSTSVKATGATGEDGHTPVITIGQNGNWFVDGVDTTVKAKGEDASFETYSITFDYGKAKQFFDDAIDAHEIKSTEWLTNLPTIKSAYQEQFLGWFITGTNKEIENFDFIGGDVNLEARFIVNENAPSGLYQNGKYVKTWTDLKNEIPNLITNDTINAKVINENHMDSYFNAMDIHGEIVVDESISTIGEAAFALCDLEGIYLKDGITTIENHAFYGCKNLANRFNLPNSITNVGNDAFGGLFDWQYEVYRYGKYMGNTDNPYMIFLEPTSTLFTQFHEDCRVISQYAFNGQFTGSPTIISIPIFIVKISTNTFVNCNSLTTVIIDSYILEEIEEGAFHECSNLTKVFIAKNGDELWKNATINDTTINSATVYYYSETEPTEAGNYWHYDTDGKTPVVWVQE